MDTGDSFIVMFLRMSVLFAATSLTNALQVVTLACCCSRDSNLETHLVDFLTRPKSLSRGLKIMPYDA